MECWLLFTDRKSTNCLRASPSHTLDRIGSKEIGLSLEGSLKFLSLGIGMTSAVFQTFGKTFISYDLLINLVMTVVVAGRLSFKILVLSYPGSLLLDRPLT